MCASRHGLAVHPAVNGRCRITCVSHTHSLVCNIRNHSVDGILVSARVPKPNNAAAPHQLPGRPLGEPGTQHSGIDVSDKQSVQAQVITVIVLHSADGR